jgi:hypothetical protein
LLQTNLLHQNPDVFPTEGYYPEEHSSYDKLRRVAKEAWEAVRADELLTLVREMPARCEAVIDAQGGYTKY